MSHLRALSLTRAVVHAMDEPAVADAKANLLNSVYLAMQDFWVAKKTALQS